MTEQRLLEIIGLVYTYPKHEKKVLDVDLANDIAKTIMEEIEEG